MKKVFGKKTYLTRSEESLMELFWEAGRPLTSVEIMELAKECSWNGNYVHKMLRSLLDKEMVRVCGTVQYGTQYARQFVPVPTREQYVARLAVRKGVGKSSIADVTAALVREVDGTDYEDVIAQLESIVEELKKRGEKGD